MDLDDEYVAPPSDNDSDGLAPPDNYLDDFDVVSSVRDDVSTRFGSVFTADDGDDVHDDGTATFSGRLAPAATSATRTGSLSTGRFGAGGGSAAAAATDADALTRRKSRGNMNWQRKLTSLDHDIASLAGKAGGAAATAGAGAAGEGDAIRVLQVDREVLFAQQALKYRNVMRPKGVAPLASEEAHLMALIQSYFIAHGFHRSATALRNAEGTPALSDAQVLLSEALPTHRLDLPKVVSDATRKTQLLFDDDRAWRSHSLFEHSIPLVVVDEKTRAEGGSLDLLVEKLILEQTDMPFTEGKPDVNFTNVFLIMSSCFACPDVLFSRFTKIFKTITAHAQLFGESRTVHLQRRVLQVLVAWTQLIAVDMTRLLTERIAAFAISTVHTGGHHFDVIKVASQLLNIAQKRRNAKLSESWQPFPRLTVVQPAGDAPIPALRPDTIVKLFTDVPEKEVARQLCLISFELFQTVRPREFINCAWMDPIMKDVCRDLEELMLFFENVALWVASLIVTPVELAERRAMYSRCVRIARMFYDLQNFYMTQAFLNGIDHSCVTRLADTVAASTLDQEVNESLDAIRTALNPFQNIQKNMPYKLNTPCLPDIAPYLSEMCHASENAKSVYPAHSKTHADSLNAASGGPGAGDDGTSELINWSKMLQVGKVIIRLISFQSIPYKFQPLPIVQRLLRQMPGKRDAETLFRLSKEREGAMRR